MSNTLTRPAQCAQCGGWRVVQHLVVIHDICIYMQFAAGIQDYNIIHTRSIYIHVYMWGHLWQRSCLLVKSEMESKYMYNTVQYHSVSYNIYNVHVMYTNNPCVYKIMFTCIYMYIHCRYYIDVHVCVGI